MSTNQQEHRNRSGGYWVAAADPEAASEAITGSVDETDRVALLSDGAARAVDVFGQHDWHGLLEHLNRTGPEALINQVRATEGADRHGQRWPRFKASDDAACVYTELSRSEAS